MCLSSSDQGEPCCLTPNLRFHDLRVQFCAGFSTVLRLRHAIIRTVFGALTIPRHPSEEQLLSNFYGTLQEVLKQDARLFTPEGELLRNTAFELGYKADVNLLRLLLANEETRNHFFVEVDDVMVFDSQRFGWVVNNREFLPDSFTRFKNSIGLVNRQGIRFGQTQDVELVWPYKDCWLEGGQTKDDEQRIEVFYNEMLAPDEVDRLLAPKVLSAAQRFTPDGQSEVSEFDESDNLIIKGNNLLVLASLMKRYEGRVKMVYIDPPYNPENKNNNTFSYNNRFNHSTWLTFMSNRLRLAKKLLRADGVLVCAIDDNEQSYLGVLLNELFPEYDIECVSIVHNPRGAQGAHFSYVHESAYFVIPKNQKLIGDRELGDIDWSPFRNWGGESLRTDARTCFYPVIVENDEIIGFGDVLPHDTPHVVHPESQTVKEGNRYLVYPIDSRGIERKWRYGRETVEKCLLRAKKTKTGYEIELGKSTGMYKSVWQDPLYDANAYGTQLVKQLIGEHDFSFPKSLYNVLDCLKAVVGDDPEALIVDFFAGSGTTGHATLELNKKDGGTRRFILIEQMDYVETVTAPRVAKVIEEDGAGSFTYCELLQLNEAQIQRTLDADSPEALLSIWQEISGTGLLSYRIRPEDFDGASFEALPFEDQQRLLLAALDKNLLYVNVDSIDDADYAVPEQAKSFTRSFYDLHDAQ